MVVESLKMPLSLVLVKVMEVVLVRRVPMVIGVLVPEIVVLEMVVLEIVVSMHGCLHRDHSTNNVKGNQCTVVCSLLIHHCLL